jgi:hypothetical protein
LTLEASRPRADRPRPAAYLPRIVVPFATVEVARAHAATLESASRSHRGRDRSGRASQPAPCRRGRHGVRAEPSSRTGIPLLRLPVGSKGWEVLEFAVAHHVGPPLYCLTMRSGEGSVAEARDSVRQRQPPASGLGRPIWPSAEWTAGGRWTNGRGAHRCLRRPHGIEAPGLQG